MARNYFSKHTYTGINMVLMNCAPYPIPYFLTFQQAKMLGGSIRKGAKAEQVIYFNICYKDASNNTVTRDEAKSLKTSGQEVQILKFIKYYNVFNVQDLKGIELELPEVQLKNNEKIERCEDLISSMPNPPKLEQVNGNRAFYNPIADKVNMPDIRQFESSAEYYVTLFHEMSHATGHPSRLNRPTVTEFAPFGSKLYSIEELTAEMGASFLSAYCGIDYDSVTENSAAYIAGWLKRLKEDKTFIFKAAAEAQKAVDFIKGKD